MKKNCGFRLSFLIFLSLFIFLPTIQCLSGTSMNKSLVLKKKDMLNDSLVIAGTVINREEVWDRRTNPMMGRPDFLKEIIFHIQIVSVISGDAPNGSGIIRASVKDQKMLLKFKVIPKGKSGIFTLRGNKMPYVLINFVAIPGNISDSDIHKDSIEPKKKEEKYSIQENNHKKDSLKIFEKKSGKEMISSKLLQKKAVHFISRKYGMKNPEFISLTSFSGPSPPEGGYIHWGIRGQIKGKWFVWQPGTNGKLREGKELYDPHRYQKCNSPQTKIMTPSGSVAISNFKISDTVLSGNNKVAVRILKVTKVRTGNHHVCQTIFDDGTIIEISPGHPLADGRLFGALKIGDVVNGRRVLKNELIPYQYEYTWDILPDSPSGTYFIGGLEIASTMKY